MKITVSGGGYIVECEICQAGRVCYTRIAAETFATAHVCKGGIKS